MYDGLWELLQKAKRDETVRKRIIETKKEKDPQLALCELSTELGCPFTVGDMFEQGEEFLSNVSVGCRGVCEPFDGWGDAYGQFFASLEGLEK